MSQGIRKTRKVWLGIGASVLASTLASPAQAAGPMATVKSASPHNAQTGKTPPTASVPNAPAFHLIAEGEAGEGGEAGIDPATAATDPVAWNVAIAVMAAHVVAGDAALSAGKADAGREMFAHAYAEIYAEMEEPFKKRGVQGLGEALTKAMDLAGANPSPGALKKMVAALLEKLDQAAAKGPLGATSLATRAKTLAQMLDRAALQYQAASKSTAYEPYLDGYGFTMAAARIARATLPELEKTNPSAAKALGQALKTAQSAFPGAQKPAQPTVEIGKFLAQASSAVLSVSGMN